MCFDGVFFRKAQDFSNPYFKDVQNMFSRGQKLSSVRDTSQECCEHPTSHNRPHLIVWYRTPSQTSISRKGMTLTYKIGVIKKGDLVLSMIGSGVLMISSVFLPFFSKSQLFLTPYDFFLGTCSICGSEMAAGSPISTIYSP